MKEALSFLRRKDVLVIFAYAPAGLGHLRVTHALYSSLPEGLNTLLLGSHDKTIAQIHHVISSNHLVREFFEFAQSGAPEDFFTYMYRSFLGRSTEGLYEQLTTILGQSMHVISTLVVVCTHFGLAHQLVEVKDKLDKEKGVRLIVIVQVTDDSPQHIWYVPRADLIFVPSAQTGKLLAQYGRTARLLPTRFRTVPYPVSLKLTEILTKQEFADRSRQVNPSNKSLIHISVPISGGAVGLPYLTYIIEQLHRLSARFIFHVVSKTSESTHRFLQNMERRDYVHIYTSTHDREIVTAYELLFARSIITLEITKPSEQSFKSLINPLKRGGVLLLFAPPVGRQEYDNLYFLRRHRLLPTESDQAYLWYQSANNNPLNLKNSILVRARSWRSLNLPEDSLKAAHFIYWCLHEGIFSRMLEWSTFTSFSSTKSLELGDDGAVRFWRETERFLKSKIRRIYATSSGDLHKKPYSNRSIYNAL